MLGIIRVQYFDYSNDFIKIFFNFRVDAVASRVQTALTTRKVTNSMAGVVKAMDAAMKGMNLEKISGLMDKFEQQFEDLGDFLNIYDLFLLLSFNNINKPVPFFRCSK